MVCIHINIFVYIYFDLSICIRLPMFIYSYICFSICICTFIYMCMIINPYTHLYTHIYIYISIYLSIDLHLFIYIYIASHIKRSWNNILKPFHVDPDWCHCVIHLPTSKWSRIPAFPVGSHQVISFCISFSGSSR